MRIRLTIEGWSSSNEFHSFRSYETIEKKNNVYTFVDVHACACVCVCAHICIYIYRAGAKRGQNIPRNRVLNPELLSWPVDASRDLKHEIWGVNLRLSELVSQEIYDLWL